MFIKKNNNNNTIKNINYNIFFSYYTIMNKKLLTVTIHSYAK